MKQYWRLSGSRQPSVSAVLWHNRRGGYTVAG